MVLPTSDPFSGASLDPKWTLLDPLNALSAPPSVSGGMVTFAHGSTVNTNFLGSTNRNAPRITQPIGSTDLFELRMKFNRLPKQARFLRQAIIIERADRQQAITFQFVVVSSGTTYRLQWGYYGASGDTTWTTNQHATNWDNVTDLAVKREAGDVYSAWYSLNNGTSWTQFGTNQTLAVGTFAPAVAGLMVARESGAAVSFEFTDFQAIGSGPNHDFGATGAESTTETGSGALTQSHAFGAVGAEVATESGTGQLAQRHVFGATGAEVSTETGAAALAQRHAFGAVGAEAATETGSAELTQDGGEPEPGHHTFGAIGAELATETGAAALSQRHAFGAVGAEALTETGTAVLNPVPVTGPPRFVVTVGAQPPAPVYLASIGAQPPPPVSATIATQ